MTRTSVALLAIAPVLGFALGMATSPSDEVTNDRPDDVIEHTDPRDGRVWIDPALGDWKACVGTTLIVTLGDVTREVPYAPECEVTP